MILYILGRWTVYQKHLKYLSPCTLAKELQTIELSDFNQSKPNLKLQLNLTVQSLCMERVYASDERFSAGVERVENVSSNFCHTHTTSYQQLSNRRPYQINLMFHGSANSVFANNKIIFRPRVHWTWGRGYVVTGIHVHSLVPWLGWSQLPCGHGQKWQLLLSS